MMTFRTEEETRNAGWQITLDGRDNRPKPVIAFRPEDPHTRVRILSPETLKCVEALEDVEWCGTNRHEDAVCPGCYAKKDGGKHRDYCKLDLALKAVGVR